LQQLQRGEPSAEISGSRGIRNSLSAHRVKKRFVVAPVFEMIQTGATGKQIQGDVENMISFVVRHMQFKNGSRGVHMLSQVELFDQLHDDSNPAARDGLLIFGKFQLGCRRPEHGRKKQTFSLIDSVSQLSVALPELTA